MSLPFYTAESMLAQLPGYVLWKDVNSKFIVCNLNTATALIGYSNIDQVVGLTDSDARCDVALCAHEFHKQDQKVVAEQRSMVVLDIHPYACGLQTMISTKEPFYDASGHILGIYINMVKIDSKMFGNIYSKLTQLDKPFKDKHDHAAVSSEIVTSFDFAKLSERESEVLYYLVRGFTAKTIGLILKLATRTVETHINNIKSKAGVCKKSDLVMFCIESGFLNQVPKSIFNKLANLSIEI